MYKRVLVLLSVPLSDLLYSVRLKCLLKGQTEKTPSHEDHIYIRLFWDDFLSLRSDKERVPGDCMEYVYRYSRLLIELIDLGPPLMADLRLRLRSRVHIGR